MGGVQDIGKVFSCLATAAFPVGPVHDDSEWFVRPSWTAESPAESAMLQLMRFARLNQTLCQSGMPDTVFLGFPALPASTARKPCATACAEEIREEVVGPPMVQTGADREQPNKNQAGRRLHHGHKGGPVDMARRKTRARDGLYERENGILAFRYKHTDGGWKEKYTGETDRKEARTRKHEFLEDLRKGTLPTKKAEWMVEQAATRWVEQHAAHLNSEKAQRNEQSLLRQLTRRFGTRKLKSITLDDLKDYQRDRRKEVGERAINLEAADPGQRLEGGKSMGADQRTFQTFERTRERNRTGPQP